MGHPRYSPEQIAARAKALYEREIRAKVEQGNKGQYLVIDIETGDYEMDEDHFAASKRSIEKHPDGIRFAMRIGYPTIGRIGARLAEAKR